MSGAPRAERLRSHFVGWQCRVRAEAMRRRAGRPSPGMQPALLDAEGAVLAAALTTLLVRREEESYTPEFRHLARRTHDPRDRREAALTLLSERYYQHTRDFSGLLTATFAAESPLAARLAFAGQPGRCHARLRPGQPALHVPGQPCGNGLPGHSKTAACEGRGLHDPLAARRPGGTTRSFNPQLPPDAIRCSRACSPSQPRPDGLAGRQRRWTTHPRLSAGALAAGSSSPNATVNPSRPGALVGMRKPDAGTLFKIRYFTRA